MHVNMFADGSIVYRLDHDGEIFKIIAWARNSHADLTRNNAGL
jgi:hypothetical protein